PMGRGAKHEHVVDHAIGGLGCHARAARHDDGRQSHALGEGLCVHLLPRERRRSSPRWWGDLMLIAAIMGAMGGAAGVVAVGAATIASFAQQARITYMSDGSITALCGGLVGETWVTPANPSVAAGYEIRFSNATGDTSELIGSDFNTWLPLTSDRMVGVNIPQGLGT